jgi:hypothetical protein
VNRVLRSAVRRGGGVGGYSPGRCILHGSAATYSKMLITYIKVTVPAPDIQNSTAIVS